MSIDKHRIYRLARKIENNTISESELEEFNSWYNSFDDETEDDSKDDELLRQRILDSVKSDKYIKHRYLKIIGRLSAIGIAASILFFSSWLLYKQNYKSSAVNIGTVSLMESDAIPGKDRAVLTLSDGRKLDLDTLRPGLIAVEGRLKVFKTSDKMIRYEMLNERIAENSNSAINIITVPKGGKYKAELPDGSQVWLNSNSSLRMALNFGESDRKVDMSGECYFEVAKSKNKIFRVVTQNQVIEVLGTHFNVTSYSGETQCKVTLLEGAVKIISANKSEILKPGQEAEISTKSNNVKVSKVDTNPAVAWKSGFFEFNHTDFKTLMAQLSRWYDVEVVYQGQISNDFYEGRISRNVNLSEVLKILENGGVTYKIEGKKLIVTGNTN